jgi:hypothetical protein
MAEVGVLGFVERLIEFTIISADAGSWNEGKKVRILVFVRIGYCDLQDILLFNIFNVNDPT